MLNTSLTLKKDFSHECEVLLFKFRLELLPMTWMCKVLMFLGKKPFAVFVSGNTDCALDLPKVDLMVFRVEKLSEQSKLLCLRPRGRWARDEVMVSCLTWLAPIKYGKFFVQWVMNKQDEGLFWKSNCDPTKYNLLLLIRMKNCYFEWGWPR